MKVLIIGSGGREHALAWRLAQSPEVTELFAAPGNPGMETLPNGRTVQRLEIDVSDMAGLKLFAQRESIDLTVVGPEAPLAAGIADAFVADGLAIFGPCQAGAQIEASKAWAKALMEKAGVPTAGYRFCETQDAALAALAEFTAPYVIKEDGLAAGKGVTIAPDPTTAHAAIAQAFAKAMPVVIEEFLAGEELSVLALCDGERAIPMVSAQDFKKVGEGNTGPNTGGMGAYAPVPFVTPPLMQRIQEDVLAPMMAAFRAEGIDYRGVLYAGLMISPSGDPKVIEFNARFGDPETQVVLPLLDEDLFPILKASAAGDLSPWEKSGFAVKNASAVTVVLASEGYPGDYTKAKPITFGERPATTAVATAAATATLERVLLHAGTQKRPNGQIVTHGGRVLNATGVGRTLAEAREHAYALAETVTFEGAFCRRDIAQQAAESLKSVV